MKKLKLPREKLIKVLLIVGLAAIAGIFLSESLSKSDKNKTEKAENESTSQRLREYESETEKRLCEILSSIDGIGSCSVMVTLESGEESVYSSDVESSLDSSSDSSSSSQKNKFVIIDDDGEQPVLEKEIEPKIRGVIVVCEGADDVYVRQAVTDCLTAGLGISSANISVVRGGKNG